MSIKIKNPNPHQLPVADNKIVIRIRNGQAVVTAERGISFEDLLATCCTLLLGAMREIHDRAHPDQKDACKGGLYDTANAMFSRTLELFAPEYELRPGLTAQAILEAENRIIMEGRLKDVEPHS